MAFMRAVHEDPPMKPLFPGWYHMQNDELLGSWLVLLANVPVVPYSLIYLSKDRTNWVYMGSLVVSIVLVIGSTLFVQACYPSDKVRMRVGPYMTYLVVVPSFPAYDSTSAFLITYISTF
jgi:hypothetical protein